MEHKFYTASETQEQYNARCAHDLNQSQIGTEGYTNWSGEESGEEMSEEEWEGIFPNGIWA